MCDRMVNYLSCDNYSAYAYINNMYLSIKMNILNVLTII